MSYSKPRVAIIYSDSENFSNESKNFALYIGGEIAIKGQGDPILIGFKPDGSVHDHLPSNVKYSIELSHNSAVATVPASGLSFSHWDMLEKCHVVIVATNWPDGDKCVSKILEVLPEKKNLTIFCLQRGILCNKDIKDRLSTKYTALDCAVGFAVVVNSKRVYTPTLRGGQLMIERLSVEQADVADGPVNLIENTGLSILYQRDLHTYAWGLVVYEVLYVINALSGGSLNHTLSTYRWRLLYAACVRETCKALGKAARGGLWKPNLGLISDYYSPWILEMILLLPWPLFDLARIFTAGFPPARNDACSPGQSDWADGRMSMAQPSLKEIIKVADRYKVKVPVCEALLLKVKNIEAARFSPEARTEGSARPYTGSAKEVDSVIEALGGIGKVAALGRLELRFWGVRLLSIVLICVLLRFLFFHGDY